MCWLCEEYGNPEHETGLWYLNPFNYARNMYKLREPGAKMTGAGVYLEGGARGGPTVENLVEATESNKLDEVHKITQQVNKNTFTGGD